MDANARHCDKTCLYHLRRIHQLRRHIHYDTLYTLIRVLILSRLNYCSQSTLRHVQRVQDAAARLLCIYASSRSHASPLRKRLYWLPVSSRIQFKLCTLMFDIQRGVAPLHLAELCDRCDDTWLCSAEGNVEWEYRVYSTTEPVVYILMGGHCAV